MTFDIPAQLGASAALALALALALQACAVQEPAADLENHSAHMNLARASLDPNTALAEVNAYRAQNGLNALRLDPALGAFAERQAEAMAAAGVISHDVKGSFSSRLSAAGLDGVAAAENAAAGTTTFKETLAGWRASPGHNANLLMADATRFGVGLGKNPATRYGAFWAMAVAAEKRPESATKQPRFMFGGCWPLCP